MAGFVQDLRHAVRMLAKTPALTAAGVFTLALGIGATTTIFSFVHGVLLKPLPYRDPDRIVLLFETSERARKAFGLYQIPVSPAMGLEWKARAHSFQSLGMFRGTQSNLGGGAQPERLRGALMTAGAFEAMGVQPLAGRVFSAGDESANNDSLVVIGERLWRSRLGGDLGVVGRTIRLDGKPLTVIGIMPQSFSFPRGYELAHDTRIFEAPNFWRLLVLQPADRFNMGNHNTSVIARLKPGVTAAKAQSELASIESAVYERVDAASAKEFGVAVKPYHENLVSQSRGSLLLLGGAVLLVLLIACTNVAGLLIVQAVARGREMALRASLGAAPGRLMRQVLTESALLGLLGCAAGTLLSVWGVETMRGLAGARLVRVESVSVDGAALAFSVAASLLTAGLFGLAPALVAARLNLVEHLKEGGRASAGAGHSRLRAALVVAQVALSMTLLSAAGLLARSFYQVLQADRGFRIENVLTMRITLPPYRYATELARREFFERLIGEISALPAVESAGVINQLPLTGEGNIHSITIEGRQVKSAEEPVAEIRTATPAYFDAIQLPLRAGRWFSAGDHADAPGVAVINETMARRFWPGGNAVGKQFREGQRATLPWVTVVGVTADSRQASLEKAITPQIFRPYAQEPLGDMVLAVRTRVEPSHAVAAILERIRRIDPEQPVAQVKTMQEVLEESVSSRRLQTYVLGAFAVYALMLATVGLHGTIAYSVTQRTREFAVRTALGARREELMAMVVRQGVVLAVGGLFIGLACALALGRVLAGYLYGVTPRDPATLAVVAVLLLISAVSAAFAPAWRAAKVDPINALRAD